MKKFKKVLSFFGKLLISIILLAWVILKTDFTLVFEMLADIKPIWIVATLFMMLLSLMLVCLRWSWLLQTLGYRFNYLKLFRIYWSSNSLGVLVPGNIGGEILRIYGVVPDSGHIPAIASSLVTDRVIGFISVALLSLVCMFISFEAVDGMTNYILVVAISLGLLLVILYFSTHKKIITKIDSYSQNKIFRKIMETLHKVSNLRDHKGVLTKCLILSIGIQLIRVLTAYFFAVSIDTQISLVYFLIFVPIIFFFRQLPISINGIGVYQGLFVWFFGKVGMSTTEAFTISTGLMLLGYVMTLGGGFLYLWKGIRMHKNK